VPDEKYDDLVCQLTASQCRLYRYILSMVPDRELARDILQQTNLVIWKKADEFQQDTSFWAWASRIAHFKVLTAIRDSGRDRHLFDEQMLSNLREPAKRIGGDDSRRDALVECLKKMNQVTRELLDARYVQNNSVKEIAERTERSEGSVKMLLMRARRNLLKCIQFRLITEPTA